jgi:hypothetical protein
MDRRFPVVVALCGVVAACGSERHAAAEEASERPPARVTREEYGKSRAVYADSVLRTAKPASEVVKDFGAEYLEATPRMVDSLTTLSSLTDCFETGRRLDPYLAGTVSYSVYMSSVGSTLIQIQQSKWTSLAGNVVNACLNLAAREWAFGTEFGRAGRQVAQVQFK